MATDRASDRASDETIEAALARVPWSRMQHAAGSAEDVPELVRAALSSPRASERAEARRALRERVLPGGHAVEPTAPVTALLASALGRIPEDDRAAVVALLAELAHARAAAPRELGWARATHRAAWSARQDLLALLAVEGDDALLVQVPFALVALIEGGGDGAPEGTDLDALAHELALAIAARARRPATEEAHAGLAFALGHLAKRVPALVPALRAALERAPWPARTASAIGVLRAAPLDEAATDVLIEALRRRGEHASWTSRRFPWHAGHLRFFLVAVLAGDRVSDAGFARAVPVLADLARRDASPDTLDEDVLRPLARALEGHVITPSTTRGELPAPALALLDALYDNPAMWAGEGLLGDALRVLGVPGDVRGWGRLLGRG